MIENLPHTGTNQVMSELKRELLYCKPLNIRENECVDNLLLHILRNKRVFQKGCEAEVASENFYLFSLL